MKASELQKQRRTFHPPLAKVFAGSGLINWEERAASPLSREARKVFPHLANQPLLKGKGVPKEEKNPMTVGVLLSGGQAAGGHNCICALGDALWAQSLGHKLYGFLGGPSGLIDGEYRELTKEHLDEYLNEGGFDLLRSGRTKIETKEQFESVQKTVEVLGLDALVIIGGDDTNTNAALLAEYFLSIGSNCSVIGLPKTIDGDMRGQGIEMSFGFDTAAKVYAEMIGNIARDAASAGKYYHMIKVMGRTASHIALECALQVQPNLTFIGEEVQAKGLSLVDITNEIADLIVKRAEQNKNFGVVVFPEGLIEFIPEMKTLVGELNEHLATGGEANAIAKLSSDSKLVFETLPERIQKQLTLDRDSHGNVQVSHIQTEALFIDLVQRELKKRKEAGKYKGKFSPIMHFFGYEGRSCLPSNFDATYCYNLGYAAAHLALSQKTGYIVALKGLASAAENWSIEAIPLPSMITFEMRKGKNKPVIKKQLVDLEGNVFKAFAKNRVSWVMNDEFMSPGPIQYWGPESEKISQTLLLESQ